MPLFKEVVIVLHFGSQITTTNQMYKNIELKINL